jgi:hypothetical protein
MSAKKIVTTCNVVDVTPEMAREWLKWVRNQRHISPLTVAGYADEMRNKRWKLTSDAIMFNSKGDLVNGQHRLSAIAQSSAICPFIVMENADDDAAEVTDLGRVRSVPDMLKMLYGIGRARMVTSAIRVIDDFVHDHRLKLSVGHVLARLEIYGEAFKWATESMPGKSAFSSSPVIGALVYAYPSAPSSVETFARKACAPAELPATSPVLSFRRHMEDNGFSAGCLREEKRITFMLCLHAIYKSIQDEPAPKRLKVREDMLQWFGAHYAAGKRTVAA